MHSRIFQLSAEPISKDDYIDSCEFEEHWFTREIADYVAGCDREDAIQWLKTWVKGCKIESDEKGIYLIVENKGEYFTPSYNKFKETLEKIKDCKITEFVSCTLQSDIWCLKNYYNERYGFYVYDASDGVLTFDEFIRNATLNQKYYIGNALDYHS